MASLTPRCTVSIHYNWRYRLTGCLWIFFRRNLPFGWLPTPLSLKIRSGWMTKSSERSCPKRNCTCRALKSASPPSSSRPARWASASLTTVRTPTFLFSTSLWAIYIWNIKWQEQAGPQPPCLVRTILSFIDILNLARVLKAKQRKSPSQIQ